MLNCKRNVLDRFQSKNSSLVSYRNKTYVCPYKGIEQFFCNNLLTKSSSVLEPIQNAFSGHSSWNKIIFMYLSNRLRVENTAKILSGRSRSRRSPGGMANGQRNSQSGEEAGGSNMAEILRLRIVYQKNSDLGYWGDPRGGPKARSSNEVPMVGNW